MKTKNILKSILVKTLMFSSLISCSYLDVSDELAGGITSFEDIFSNVDRTKKWYGQCFANRPDYSRMWSTAGMGNCWSWYADEIYTREGLKSGKYNEWNSSGTTSHRWYDLYESIRQCNIFLEQAHPIIEEGGPDASRLTAEEIAIYKANVRFMRAAYYYYLMEMYGPVPLVTQSYVLTDNLDLARNSIDEVIEFIDTELTECMEDMHQEPYHNDESYRAVPTRGTAMALRAKAWVYAASPLFNGKWESGKNLVNKDGKRLFSDYSTDKIDKAVGYLAEFLEYAAAGARYTLYQSATGKPEDSLYELFQEYNNEIIWATSTNYWGGLGAENFDSHCTPRNQPKGLGGMDILQELVDDFYCADGLPISDESFLPKSPDYTESGFTTYDGYEVSNMYVGREPRFYNTVTFSGKKWHISGDEIQFYKGGNCDNSVADGAPYTGYLCYKRYNRTIYGLTPGVNTKYRPSIIFRLAEFYLLYAEMLNEQDPTNSDILVYLNKVRNRAGLPNIEILNPSIVGNQELQRKAIQRESRVELCTEGQRYFDVRRWLIAGGAPGEGGQGGDFHGMNPNATKVAFHTRTKWQTRSFKDKNYFYPIPLDEIKRSEYLVQNPGW